MSVSNIPSERKFFAITDIDVEWNKFGEEKNRKFIDEIPVRRYDISMNWTFYVPEQIFDSLKFQSKLQQILNSCLDTSFNLVLICKQVKVMFIYSVIEFFSLYLWQCGGT